MSHGYGFSRAFGVAPLPRKCFIILLLLLVGIFLVIMYSGRDTIKSEEYEMEETVVELETHLQFVDSLFRARREDLIAFQNKLNQERGNDTSLTTFEVSPTSITPELLTMLKSYTGSKAASGVHTKHHQVLRTPFVYQLLPHLMDDPNSVVPLYHMKSGREFVDVVVGIPTVKRDKESYLLITLTQLINGLRWNELKSTLIIVFVGETDLEYVLHTARQIEIRFPKHVKSGLIEVLSPSPSYYPNFDNLEPTLGDSMKRVKWRTKQNLDAIYLMSYAQTKGTYYLMLEDDVIARMNYMQDIKRFAISTSMSNPHWFFIEFCHIGGIGKLFHSSDLIHFITYVQLFYKNMPIDWLLESYLADRVCNMDKTSKVCIKNKSDIRPKFKTSLFQHIGLYSSLKGKIQKVKIEMDFGAMPSFYPHSNPPLEFLKTNIHAQGDHTLRRAYEGETYFWGIKPKKGDIIEFRFQNPTLIRSYTFRSGNIEHSSDKFYDAVVEVILAGTNNSTVVGIFDEFGLADGELKKEMGPLAGIRLRVKSDSFYWVILSEIELKTFEQRDSS